MATTMRTLATCSHCNRKMLIRADNGLIAHHGPRKKPCPGSLTVPGSAPTRTRDPLTDGEVRFLRHCWQLGDAYAVSEWLDVMYQPEFLVTDDVDAEFAYLIEHARRWIEAQVRKRT